MARSMDHCCYESGRELTVETSTSCRFPSALPFSFLLIVILISILAGTLITTENTLLRIALKLLLLPVVMSVSYEIIKLCGRYDNPLTRAVSAPGLWLQRITTSEPDDGMIECAIASRCFRSCRKIPKTENGNAPGGGARQAGGRRHPGRGVRGRAALHACRRAGRTGCPRRAVGF